MSKTKIVHLYRVLHKREIVALLSMFHFGHVLQLSSLQPQSEFLAFYPFIKKLKGGAAKISFATPPFYVLTLSIFGPTPRARGNPSVLFYRLEPMKTPRVCFTSIAKVLNFSQQKGGRSEKLTDFFGQYQLLDVSLQVCDNEYAQALLFRDASPYELRSQNRNLQRRTHYLHLQRRECGYKYGQGTSGRG